MAPHETLVFFNLKQLVAEATMKLDLLYNPAAGTFRQSDLDTLIRAFERRSCELRVLATRPGETSVSGTADLVCVMGGDGALRQVIAAMGADAGRVPICVAPAGTINLVARELGYPRNREQFAEQIVKAWNAGPERWVKSPLYEFAGLPLLACFSVGPDSVAVSSLDPALKKRIGRYAYGAAALRMLRDWPRGSIPLSGELADGTPFECRAEGVFVARGRYYAGPFRLSPRAELTSQTIELVTLKRASRSSSLAFGSALAAHLPLDRVGLAEIRSVRRVVLGECDMPVQVDGDWVPGCSGEIRRGELELSYCV